MKLASTTLTVALLTILGTACPEPGGGGGTGGGNAGGGSAGGGAGGGGASSCDATSCPGGCCQGTTCLTGTQDASCGRQGVACQACAAPQLCVANACAVPPAIGDACASAAVCGPGRRCDESAPGGYCYQPCAGTTCPAASTCIGGGLSADGSPIPSLCLKTCAMEADCRTGFKCEALLGSPPVCTSKCKADPDCESGVCEKATGRCITASVGTTCTRSTDCVGGLQCYSGAGIPGGYCSRNCGQTTCPGASRCVTLGDSESVCLLTCTVTADCRSGYECAAGACAPRCSSNAQCGFGKQCNTTTGRCVESGPAVRSIGAACTQASDCDSNVCFDQASTGTPGGACTQSCQAATCPTGSVCAGTGVAAVCTFPCPSITT